jgi:NCS1 family nucleobase:cation symporter-1
MAGLAIFLAPIAAITATDYWFVKNRHIDVPSLYRRHARYRYHRGANWRAGVAFLISLLPNVPGLAHAVNEEVEIGLVFRRWYAINYLYGLFAAGVVYWGLSYFWPARETLLEESIYHDGDRAHVRGQDVLEGVECSRDGSWAEGKDVKVEISSLEREKKDREIV